MFSDSFPQIGTLLDQKYELRQFLGQGGCGTVFLARHVYMERDVAIKLLHPGAANDENFRARFFREAKVTSQLRHPNIVTVHDFGVSEGTPYLVMEYVQGQTLRSLLHEKQTLTAEEIFPLALQIAAALKAAHALGVVHRDLKPENIILSELEGELELKVLDFGIAKFFEQSDQKNEREQMTEEGIFQGTPRYASPEQIMNQPLDGRSDIYSLGVILYEALVGTPPFQAQSSMEVALMHLHAEVIPPSKCVGLTTSPSYLENIILRTLEKDVNRRVRDAGTLWQMLSGVYTTPNLAGPLPFRRHKSFASMCSTLAVCGIMFSTGVPQTRAAVEPAPQAVPAVVAPLPSKSEQLDALFTEAQRSYNNKQYSDAAVMFRNVLAARPGDISTKFYLAWSYKQLGKNTEALALLDTLDMKVQNDERIAYQLALLNAQVGRMDSALKHLEQAAKDNVKIRDAAKKEPLFVATMAKNPRYRAIVEPEDEDSARREKARPQIAKKSRTIEQRFGSMLESANRSLKEFF